jgi:toxin ParE1/3/4
VKAVRYHRDALAEYDEAIGHYADIDPDLGRDCRIALEKARAKLRESPRSHVQDEDTACRVCTVKKFPYSFYYLEFDDHIWIVAVAHHKRKPGFWHHRLRQR